MPRLADDGCDNPLVEGTLAETTMTPSRLRQIEGIFNASLERAGGERASFLDHACCGDDELRREVESLLSQDAARTNFLDPHAGAAEDPAESTVTVVAAGMQIGV